MATLQTYTVTPAGQGGTYATVAEAITALAAANADLVAADVYAEIVISGTWSAVDAGQIITSTLNTDSTRYLKIYTTGAARHAGIWSTSKYIVASTGSVVGLQTEYVWIDGLQVNLTGTSGNYGIYADTALAADNKLVISNCIVNTAANTHADVKAIYNLANATNANMYIYNTISIADAAAPWNVMNNSTSMTVYSSVIVGGVIGLHRNDGTVTAKNVYCGNTTTADFSGTITETNCASEDTTAGGTNHTHAAYDTDTFVNVTGGSEDFHLAIDGASPLQAAGVDTSGDSAPMNFTTDIDGDTRDATWDIGADAAAAATKTNVVYMTFES